MKFVLSMTLAYLIFENEKTEQVLSNVGFAKQDKQLRGKILTDNVNIDGFKFKQKEICIVSLNS